MSQAQILSFPSPTVSLINGRPATTSLEVANFFGKRHDHVIRDIRTMIADVPAEIGVPNFGETTYTDEQNGQTYPMFTLYRDGFMLLVMGYTGKKAMQIKITYIMAFNAMQEKLDNLAAEEQAGLAGNVNPFSLSPAQQAHIHAIVAAKVGMLPIEVQRKAYGEVWSRFGRHFQIAKYQQLPPTRMGEAVEYLVGMEVKAAQRALPPAPSAPYVARLQLTQWDKVQLGKEAVTILERSGKVGQRTLDCILLKLRYLDAIQDVQKLGNNLAADINKMRVGVFGKIVQAGNTSGCMTDSVMDILCEDTYNLQRLARDFEMTAFRALNASICGAKMQGV